jgi:AAA+ superfamily predicted ATPase
MLNINNNLDKNSKKRKNRYRKNNRSKPIDHNKPLTFDASYNNLYIPPLHTSSDIILRKPFYDSTNTTTNIINNRDNSSNIINNQDNSSNIINNKTNINPVIDCNTMNCNSPIIQSNKLITSLDLHNKNNPSVNIDREKTDILLKFLLKQSEDDFYSKYNSSFFSGMPTIPLSIENKMPSIGEEMKNIEKEHIHINEKVDCLLDLIHLCDKYPLADNVEYNINMKAIHNIKSPLTDLQNMIGMKSIKENIVDQILYFVQDLHNISPNNADYLHTVICGPPGTGKTEVAKIMGKIFSNLGILKKNVFKKVTRDDLVAGFLGQTAIKTKEVIKECLGGVLFIDEAYALGNAEKRDSFSKECIDTICEALSDHKKDLMCIIAGYEHELKDCFFSFNPGLESRFTWKFAIDEYDHKELLQIFEKNVKETGWNVKEPLEDSWFEKNKSYFKYYGRDMETLLTKVKIAHSKRVFCLAKEEKTQINKEDLEKGFELYKKMGSSEKSIKEQERLKQIYSTIYC